MIISRVVAGLFIGVAVRGSISKNINQKVLDRQDTVDRHLYVSRVIQIKMKRLSRMNNTMRHHENR